MERVVSTMMESLMVSVKEKDSLTVKVSITVSVMAHLHPLCHFTSNSHDSKVILTLSINVLTVLINSYQYHSVLLK